MRAQALMDALAYIPELWLWLAALAAWALLEPLIIRRRQ